MCRNGVPVVGKWLVITSAHPQVVNIRRYSRKAKNSDYLKAGEVVAFYWHAPPAPHALTTCSLLATSKGRWDGRHVDCDRMAEVLRR